MTGKRSAHERFPEVLDNPAIGLSPRFCRHLDLMLGNEPAWQRRESGWVLNETMMRRHRRMDHDLSSLRYDRSSIGWTFMDHSQTSCAQVKRAPFYARLLMRALCGIEFDSREQRPCWLIAAPSATHGDARMRLWS